MPKLLNVFAPFAPTPTRPNYIALSQRLAKGECKNVVSLSSTDELIPFDLYSASGGVYTAYQVGTNVSVAIKQMNLEQQPKKVCLLRAYLPRRNRD